jgi:hypothetical protein
LEPGFGFVEDGERSGLADDGKEEYPWPRSWTEMSTE